MKAHFTKSFRSSWRPWIASIAISAGCLLGDCHAGASNDNLADYSAGLQAKFSDVRTISPAELETLPGRVVLLDVRSEPEYAVSHLPGAKRAGADPVTQLFEIGATLQSPIVVYCSVGYRSALLARELQAKGFTNVRNLDGSIFAWANQGLDLVNEDGPTRKVHPYNVRWGRYLNRDRWQWDPGQTADP